MFELLVVLALRFTIWLLDEALDGEYVWRERVLRFIPAGIWEAYCSFHEIDRVVISEDDEHLLEA